jgi:hypothetical protein
VFWCAEDTGTDFGCSAPLDKRGTSAGANVGPYLALRSSFTTEDYHMDGS